MSPVAATAKRRSRKLWLAPLTALLVVGAIVLPPLVNLNRFDHRIADSIGSGIGRSVRMSSVKMHLLPRPGFEIADFVVEEDPAFGAEPILRCAQVTAYVRLLSLWRGRLEIARIGFDEPSLNLVRDSRGRWNFESLLSQAAQAPNAPTSERHAGGLLRFPYIDAGNARVNFKFGDEKMPFSFLNADLAVWLANPGEWRVQFAAQPVRTDLSLDLANTGLVRLEGSLRRAPTGGRGLNRMPADLHAEWSNAPVGQLSRILVGADADWRGELDASIDIVGTTERADLKLAVKGRGIHRAEFEPHEPLNLDVACQAEFAREGRTFKDLTCLVPTGEGHLLLTGSIHAVPGHADPALSLEINHLPAAAAFDGVRLLRSGFAPDLRTTGVVDGNFSYGQSAASPRPQPRGQVTVSGLTLAAPKLEKPIQFPALHFTMNAAPAEGSHAGRRRAARSNGPVESPTLVLDPFSLAPGSLNISGAFTASGFTAHAGGQSPIGQLAALGKELGLLRNRSVVFQPQGTAEVDLTVRGPWLRPVGEPDTTRARIALDGSLRIHNAQVTADFLALPLQLDSAQASLNGNRIEWSASSMTYGPVHADGSLSYPTFCQSPSECARRFTLRIASLDAAAAQSALLGATRHGELVQQMLDRIDRSERSWPSLSGTAQIGTLTIRNLTVRDVVASLSIEDSTIDIKSLSGRAFDGALHLEGNVNLSNGTPHYEIEAQLEHAAMPELAALFEEKWGTGSIDLRAKLKFTGFDPEKLASSAVGAFHWTWAKGSLPLASDAEEGAKTVSRISSPRHPVDAQAIVAHFDTWTADGTIAKSAFTLENSRMTSGADALPLTGSISFARELDLADTDKSNPIKISGTMQQPEVSSLPASGATTAP